MRPTVAEQLRETCRILDQVVAPAISNDHAAEVLRSLVGNLNMLGKTWDKVLPFLHWDNVETGLLLETSMVGLAADLASDIAATLRAPACDPFEISQVESRNEALRALLSRLLGAAKSNEPTLAAVRAHLLARAERYPMRSILPTPQRPSGQKPSHNKSSVEAP